MLTVLIVSWLVFGTMAVFMLFYKNHQNHQILGVTLSSTHARSPEVQDIVNSYKRMCYLVLMLSSGLSLLLFLKPLSGYADFLIMLLLMVNLFLNWYVTHRYQGKLQVLKEEKGFIYQRKRIVTVDLNVVKEKGKAGISAVWSWLFLLLSFIPMIYLVFSPETRALYPIGFSLIGPFCQINMIFLYYHTRNSHTPALSENTEVNKACARTQEYIRTKGATLSALSMLVFWFIFNYAILYVRSGIAIALTTLVLVVTLLSIAFWQQKKISSAENYFYGAELKDDSHLSEQENHYKWGVYYNPNDPSIFVPKRIAGMGWTINFAHPAGKLIGVGIIVLVLAAMFPVFYGSSKDYVIAENDSQITIDAPMYDLSIEKDQIVSVSTVESLPRGSRTNGYGGASKSFGHFTFDGYGKCMIYVYHQGGEYILLELEGDGPEYVIVNDKTPEDTETLHQSIKEWLAE